MTILCDRKIAELCLHNEMITPYLNHMVRDGVISYGRSSFGYDARLGTEFKLLKKDVWPLDPKNVLEEDFSSFSEDLRVWLDPGKTILGVTVEHFRMPINVMALCVGKSTYARCGVHVLTTPLEPGWRGHVTLEISNLGKRPVWLYPGEGICQFVFFRGDHPIEVYGNRKYQDQTGVTLAKV